MTATITTIIAYLLPFIIELIKEWQAGEPQRREEQRREEIQKGRSDIASGNVVAVGSRIDGLFTSAPGDTPRLGADEDTKRRLAAITGE